MKSTLYQLIDQAIQEKASDIHLTLVNNNCQYQFRINGNLIDIDYDYLCKDGRLFQYIKFISGCELSSSVKPQTGHFNVKLENKTISCRFAIMTSLNMTCGVIRILNNGYLLKYDQLCNDYEVISAYKQIFNLHNGLVLISGATGSGKTTTAYSLLNEMKDKKIYSIEDPIEIFFDFMIQVQVNEKVMNYADAIKQIMRHDPDIIFVGEIRDEYAARMCIRCALTGHLVISTIHANSTYGAIYRLLDLNINPNSLFDTLKVITNQQLITIDNNTRTSKVDILDEKQIKNFAGKFNDYEKNYQQSLLHY